MSLIEEALRRVKDPSAPAKRTIAEPPQKTEPLSSTAHSWSTTSPATPASPPVQAVAIVTVALAIVFSVGGLLWLGSRVRERHDAASTSQRPHVSSATQRTAPSSRVKPTTTRARRARPNPAAASSHPVKTEQGLVLNGIVEGLGAPYAVINGSIVGIGEQIEGATLVEIAHGAARLSRDDRKDIVLHVSR